MAKLYAIAGSVERARLYLKAEVPYLQLRFKSTPLENHRAEIAAWGRQFPGSRLIVNDDLDFGESIGAWGVHLGQEDLRRYDPQRVRESPMQVGISTHTDAEISHALTFRPAMLGFGPVYATSTKDVAHAPQGVTALERAVARAPVPVVAIGGLTPGNIAPVVETGVAMVAMISALEEFKTVAELRTFMESLQAIS